MAQQSSNISSSIAATAASVSEERTMSQEVPPLHSEQQKDSMPRKPRRVLEQQFGSVLEEDSGLETVGQGLERLQSHLQAKAQRQQGGADHGEKGAGTGVNGEESNSDVFSSKSRNREKTQREQILAEDASSSSIMVGGDPFDNNNNLSGGNWLQMGQNNNKEQGKNNNNLNMGSQSSLAFSVAVAGGILDGSSNTFNGVNDFLENNKSGGSDQIKLIVGEDGQEGDFLVTRPKAPQKYGARQVIKPMLSGQLAQFRKFRSEVQNSNSSGAEKDSEEKKDKSQSSTTSHDDAISESGESQLTEGDEILKVQDANYLEDRFSSKSSRRVSTAQTDIQDGGCECASSTPEKVFPSRNANKSTDDTAGGRGRMRETLQRNRSRSLTDLRSAIKPSESSNRAPQQKDDLENEIEQRRVKFAAKLKEASAHMKKTKKRNSNPQKPKESRTESAPIDDSLGQMFDADDDDFFEDKIGAKKQLPTVVDSSAPRREIQSMRGERTIFSSLSDTETKTTIQDDSVLSTSGRRKAQSSKSVEIAGASGIAPALRREIQSMRGERTTFSSLLTTKTDAASAGGSFLNTTSDKEGQSTKIGKTAGVSYTQSTITDFRISANDTSKNAQKTESFENSFVLHDSSDGPKKKFEQTFNTSADRDTAIMFHESFTVQEVVSPRQIQRKTNNSSMPCLGRSVSPGVVQESSTSVDATTQPASETPKETRRAYRRHSSSSLQESSHKKSDQDMTTPRKARNTSSAIMGFFTGRNEKATSQRSGLTRPGVPPLSTPQSTPKSSSQQRVRRASTSTLQVEPMLGDLYMDNVNVEDAALDMEDTNTKFRGLSPPPSDSKPIRRNSLGTSTEPESQEPQNEHVHKIRRRRRASISGPSENKRTNNDAEDTKKESATTFWRRRTSSVNKTDPELAAAELQKQMLLSPKRGDRTRRKMTSENIAEVLATPRRKDGKGSGRQRVSGRAKARPQVSEAKKSQDCAATFDGVLPTRAVKKAEKRDSKQFTPLTPRRLRNQSIQGDNDRSSVRKQRLRRQVSHDKASRSDSSHDRRTSRQACADILDKSSDEEIAKEAGSLTPSAVRRVSYQQRYQNNVDESSSRRQSRTVSLNRSDEDDDPNIPFTPAGGEVKGHPAKSGSSYRGRSEADLEHRCLSPSNRKERRSTAHDLLKKNEAVALTELTVAPVNENKQSKRPSTKERSRRRRQDTPENDVNIGGKNDNGSVRSGRRSLTNRENTRTETSNSVSKPTLRRRKTEGETTETSKSVSKPLRRRKTEGEGVISFRRNSTRSPKPCTRIGRSSADNPDETSKRSTSRSGHTRSTHSGRKRSPSRSGHNRGSRHSRSAHIRSSHTQSGHFRDKDDECADEERSDDEFAAVESTTDPPGGMGDSSNTPKVRNSNNLSVMQGGRKRTQRESNKKGAPEKKFTGLGEGQREKLKF